jgi:isopentenyl-diphosphate delta-isomerase
VHSRRTPLHLAFSCYVFTEQGQLLATRRAYSKRTWPGVVTNSCCGHPAPGESMSRAVGRRLEYEVGISPRSIDLILPTFRYRAVMADGTIENELCPVYRAILGDEVEPAARPGEVENAWWVPWSDFVREADGLSDLSPWCALQLAQLRALGDDPADWPVGSESDLPPAAQLLPELAAISLR